MDPNPLKSQKLNTKEESQKIEITSEQKEIIKSFESLPLEWHPKMNLILTFLGQKTASDVMFSRDIKEEDFNTAVDVIKKAGLLFMDNSITEDAVRKSKTGLRVCFVANNSRDLDIISKVQSGPADDPAVYLEMGRMSGYPRTAIDVFDQICKEKNAEKSQEIKKVLSLSPAEKRAMFSDEDYAFSSFIIMSREHWKEEIAVCRIWASMIKSSNPELYQKIIKERAGRV